MQHLYVTRHAKGLSEICGQRDLAVLCKSYTVGYIVTHGIIGLTADNLPLSSSESTTPAYYALIPFFE